ncbi:hypothetical protein BaRGS_00026131 [Batillaria attramentaria]|uniref:NTF2 domain-containing protein n=1 Tax=Batillaria attramentaria TaxID=370345 RepID=A0ABD0K5B4_9CAEN
MLTPTEKQESERLLSKLTDAELRSLKDTITKKQIAVESRKEAVKAIVEYSQSAAELLRRKKLRRDFLFQYLADSGIVVPVTAEKHSLVAAILKHWGSQLPTDGNLRDIDSGTNLAAAASQTWNPQAAAASASVQTTGTSQGVNFGVNTRGSSAENSQALQAAYAGHSHVTERQGGASPENQTLGETFVSWFYKLLNAQNPAMAGTAEGAGAGDFGPQHFWQDCNMKLISVTPEPSDESYTGSLLVSQRFQALAREEQLIFNPNVSREGVRVRSNPHGLLVVMACGTIHQHSNCLGVFEQMFGLVRDPTIDNNWKIKVTQLQLVSSQVTAIPKLTDSAAADMLAIAGSSSALAVMP